MSVSLPLTQIVILAGYVLATLLIGLRFARDQKDVETYFLAKRAAPPWAVAISIISSDTTAISYLGCAALVFTSDIQLFAGAFSFPLSALFVALVFVPFLAKKKVFTVYEYLEQRFDVTVRTLASALFMLMRGSHLTVALYAASLVLAQLIGIQVGVCIFVIGGLTTLYTVFGGMKAVLWTDVIQFFVLIGGLIAILAGVAQAFHWDLAAIWHLAKHPPGEAAPWLHGARDTLDHTRAFNFSFNFTGLTFWAVMISFFLQGVGTFGSDQVLVQRYLAAGSSKQMVKSLMGGGLLQVPVLFLMYASGVFLVAYYGHFFSVPGFGWVRTLDNPNQVMTHFLAHGIPGVLGAIVLAGLFSGTMSSFSAGLNSLSSATYVDFLKRFGPPALQGKSSVAVAKTATCLWGAGLMTSAALLQGNDTIIVILARVMSPFGGPLLGIFLLGTLSRRANSLGVILGALVGAGATVYVTYFTPIHWLWYFVVGSLTGSGAGYLLSLLPLASSKRKADSAQRDERPLALAEEAAQP